MPNPTRRTVLATGLSAAACFLSPAASAQQRRGLALGEGAPFSFETLKQQAGERARRPFEPSRVEAFDTLEAIDYDAHNRITFDPDMTLWGDEGVGARFFHLGRYFKEPVTIHVVEDGEAREVLYAPEFFETPAGHPARSLPDDIGFAGFRLMNQKGAGDWMAFLGASYFRTSGPFNQYGLSARGIAVDVAASRPEEFPRFASFWLERDGTDGIIVYALLDGPSVSGAYRMVNRRDGGVIQDMDVALYTRQPIERLGVAPLTSMFWYAEDSLEPRADWRPEIHDSDGLAMWTGSGERIWRPLANPSRVMTNTFLDNNPRGFGLIQRDRSFENYQDDGVFYEKRPSLWVEPIGAWGRGTVQLVEIPTDDEVHDNIVAFWTPEEPVEAGAAYEFRYRLHWVEEAPYADGIARVVATRIGKGGRPGVPPPPGMRRFAVDIEGASLEGLDRQSGVEAVVTVSRGELGELVTYPVVGTARWRILFDLTVTGPEPVDIRAYARHGDTALCETWLYQYFPEGRTGTG